MRLGKLPARKDSIRFKLSTFVDLTALSAPPKRAGHRQLVPTWEGVLGNDQYGDCVWAGAAHETILWGAEGHLIPEFTSQSVLSDYSAVTGFNPNDPNSDQGTDMQVAASYRRKTGIVDASGKRHQVAAYLAITPGNVTELKQAIYLFSNVGIGFNFPSFAMDQFNNNQTWHLQKTNSQIEGGHYVPAVAYDGSYVYVITWGRVQKMTWGFFKKYCDEAIVYLSTEMLASGKSIEGFDVQQLQSDLTQLT